MDSPWLSYDPNPETFGRGNTNMISDQHLYDLTMAMRGTPAGDTEAFVEKWLEFVIYFNENVIDLPLYSDMRHTFHINELRNFRHSATYPYTSALIPAWLG